MKKLTAAEIDAASKKIEAWKRDGQEIHRRFEFKNFPEAIEFVNKIATIAENANHHPDIDIRWNKVTLSLTTHDAGGLTEKDFELAAKFDRLI